MKNKEFREIQLSSSHLVFIFLGILILGTFVFLLGVSVGKKQAQIIAESRAEPVQQVEQVQEEKVIPVQPEKGPAGEKPVSPPKEEARTVAGEPKKETPVAEKASLYYIQVGAFNTREAAQQEAGKFTRQGYRSTVLNPFPKDKRPVYRVRVGGYQTREEAEKARLKLKSEFSGKIDYFIVRD